MQLRLENKTVLVTGASKGIGRALAIGCAKEGADVIVNYHGDLKGAEETAAVIRELGRKSVIIQADVSKRDAITALFATARESFERLDCLINNAGITGWSDLFSTTEDKWDLVLDTNLKGTFFCSQEAAAWMKETGVRGTIVNVSTNCAALGVKNLVSYATSKAGLHGLTRQLAIELAPFGIRVNTFAPGPINVERNLRDDPDYETQWGSVIPLGRTGEAEEMIGPAVFFASNESSYITGQVLYADGGWSVQGKIPESNLAKAAGKHL
ncbi:MAG: 3-oxoacyl-ACP reductase FabG [Verrucomicrobiae bacterium]|nr:3-oxoacyl-ACP reductase FabG [Verrucomicrobiae bacterium]